MRGDQSDALLELRMRCLDRALDRFGALAGCARDQRSMRPAIAAPTAVAELPPPEACETLVDPGELALPADRAQRARAEAAEHELDRAWAAFALGRYRDARARGTRSSPRSPGSTHRRSAPRALLALTAAIEAPHRRPAGARARLERALVARPPPRAGARARGVVARAARTSCSPAIPRT